MTVEIILNGTPRVIDVDDAEPVLTYERAVELADTKIPGPHRVTWRRRLSPRFTEGLLTPGSWVLVTEGMIVHAFGAWSALPVQITVNGVQVQLTGGNVLTYERAVELADTGRRGLHSVTYRDGGDPRKPEGILAPGEATLVVNGTKISAFVTDNA